MKQKKLQNKSELQEIRRKDYFNYLFENHNFNKDFIERTAPEKKVKTEQRK